MSLLYILNLWTKFQISIFEKFPKYRLILIYIESNSKVVWESLKPFNLNSNPSNQKSKSESHTAQYSLAAHSILVCFSPQKSAHSTFWPSRGPPLHPPSPAHLAVQAQQASQSQDGLASQTQPSTLLCSIPKSSTATHRRRRHHLAAVCRSMLSGCLLCVQLSAACAASPPLSKWHPVPSPPQPKCLLWMWWRLPHH